tara:strand:- start:122 stop:472 length:351 start_codon:yes stop_codon:yes gene_type:complete
MNCQVIKSFTVKATNNEINFVPGQLIEIEPQKAEALIETGKLKVADGSILFRECCLRISRRMKPGQIIKLQQNVEFNNYLVSIENEIDATIKERRDIKWVLKKYEYFIFNALRSNY